jgi:NAD+ diphosphatase
VDLDRADRLRRDASWLRTAISSDNALFVPVWRDWSLIEAGEAARGLWLRRADLDGLPGDLENAVFLGQRGGSALFALDLSALEAPEVALALNGRGTFQDLRAVGPLLARQDGAILAYARGLLHWHKRHRFCGLCGSATEQNQGGHVRVCTNSACGTDHFPRTDPAVIMLIHDGDRCVLGRQKAWPEGMHSTLAGFVEPGESLEEAVVREVCEEVGIEVTGVTYHSSQPWPFPSSIMLGFHAQARQGPLTIDPHELGAARWFTRRELQNSPEDETFRLPRRDSIAWRLIEDWLTA